MPQSLHYQYAHLIFSTKGRKRWITAEIRPKVWAYMSGLLQNLESQSITIGGVEDHIHVVCNLSKNLKAIKVIEYLKRDSSKFVKTLDPRLGAFAWQGGLCTPLA